MAINLNKMIQAGWKVKLFMADWLLAWNVMLVDVAV
jgi:hypothetical protein